MPDVRTLIIDLCARAGLDPERDIDPLALHGKLDGMVVGARQAARTGLEPLLMVFGLDAVESDGVLCFRPRGQPPAAFIAEDDLVADGEQEPFLTVTRRQEAELPGQVDVTYLSRAANWQRAVQTSRRAVAAGRDVRTVVLPLALSDARARALADVLLFDAWVGRETVTFRLTSAFGWLEPGDVVILHAGGRSRRLRLTKTEADLLGLRCEAVCEVSTVLRASAIPVLPHVRDQRLARLAATELFLLDLPSLTDSDDDGGFYVAASWSRAEGWRWPGAELYRSDDGGATYRPVADLPGPAVWGRCLGRLPPGPTAYWDEASRLTVVVNQGELESASAAAVLNGANAAVVGDEIIQFRNAVLVGEAMYELSGFLRGRRGTEHSTGGHADGEPFILLRSYDLLRLGRGGERLGLTRHYKAPSQGQPLDEAAVVTFTSTGRALCPFSPAHVRGRRDAASGDWAISWVRRARVGGAWRDGTDIALEETAERYEVDVLHPQHDVVGTSSTEQRFDIPGDWVAQFPAGAQFTVKGNSQGNDGDYTVASVQYLSTSDKTRIFPVEPVPADGGGGVLVRSPQVARTLVCEAPSASYSAEQQVADFGATQSILTLRVCQVGATGRGQSREVTLS